MDDLAERGLQVAGIGIDADEASVVDEGDPAERSA